MHRLVVAALLVAAACPVAQAQTAAVMGIAVHEDSLVTTDSVRLYYRILGEGRETVVAPLALFHTTRLDRLARGRRLVLYDPRGRGRSADVPVEKVSLERNLSDLDAIRRAVGADQVALIGWSGLGMELFVYLLRHPDRVTRLVQLAPVAPRWTPYSELMMADRARRTDSAASAALEARVAAGEFTGKPEAECRARAAVSRQATFGDPASARLAPDVCLYPNEWPPTIGAYFGALLRSIEGFDWRDSLAQVGRIPRLVIHGTRDNTPVAGNREWVAGQPNARLLLVEGAGHWPHYERPEVVLPAIEAFLQGTWPDGSVQVP
jgi:proline iminopeptidase